MRYKVFTILAEERDRHECFIASTPPVAPSNLALLLSRSPP